MQYEKVLYSAYFFPDEWCAKVQSSPQSRTMGIPNPYLGLAMLVTILALFLAYQQGYISFWYVYALIVMGFLFSVYFLYIQAFILKAFCTWCVLSFIVFVALFTEMAFLIY